MSALLDQAITEGWFGGDVSDIAPAVNAGFLVSRDFDTGWLPREGDRKELEAYCGTVIDRLVSMKSVDIYLPEPTVIDGETEVYDLDVLLAIGAGISRVLEEVQPWAPFTEL